MPIVPKQPLLNAGVHLLGSLGVLTPSGFCNHRSSGQFLSWPNIKDTHTYDRSGKMYTIITVQETGDSLIYLPLYSQLHYTCRYTDQIRTSVDAFLLLPGEVSIASTRQQDQITAPKWNLRFSSYTI